MEVTEHLRVHSFCGLCGLPFCAKDPFFTLVNDGESWPVQITAYGIFTFPQSRYCKDPRLCRVPDCTHCTKETGTLHVGCTTLFLRQVSMLQTDDTKPDIQTKFCLLWVAATWRGLWRGGPSLNIQPDHDIHISDIINLGASSKHLPNEVLLMIRDMCIQAMCNISWHCSVLDLTRRLSIPAVKNPNDLNDPYQGTRIPLMSIKAWNRGEAPEIGHVKGEPVVRFSSDARGLLRIERLEKVTAKHGLRSDHKCYIVEAADRFKRVSVEFQFGMARLQGVTGSIHIWDTPWPPPLYRSIADPDITASSDHLQAWHLATVDLSHCTGMTFFFCGCSTYAVHAHTKTQPFADKTFVNLPLERQKTIAWIYLPIQGKVKEVGFTKLRNQPGFYIKPQHLLFQFNSGRYVLIGSYQTRGPDLVSLRQPQTLVYRKNDTLPIDFVGAFSEQKRKLRDKAFPHWLVPSRPTLENAHVSSAPLEGVCAIRVYYVSETDFCRGLIVQYVTGERLALGQCRLGVDEFREYEMPVRICFAEETAGVKIHCLIDNDHVHGRTDWTFCEMEGILYCWFNDNEMRFEHR